MVRMSYCELGVKWVGGWMFWIWWETAVRKLGGRGWVGGVGGWVG